MPGRSSPMLHRSRVRPPPTTATRGARQPGCDEGAPISARARCDLSAILDFLSTGSQMRGLQSATYQAGPPDPRWAGGHRLGEKKNENAPLWRSCGRAGSCLGACRDHVLRPFLCRRRRCLGHSRGGRVTQPEPACGLRGTDRLCRLRVQRLCSSRHTRVRLGNPDAQPDDSGGGGSSDQQREPDVGPNGRAGGVGTRHSRRPTNRRSTNRRPTNRRPTNRRPTNRRPTNRRPTNRRPTNRRPTNRRPTNRRPTNRRPTNRRPTNRRPTNRRPTNRRPSPSTRRPTRPPSRRPARR